MVEMYEHEVQGLGLRRLSMATVTFTSVNAGVRLLNGLVLLPFLFGIRHRGNLLFGDRRPPPPFAQGWMTLPDTP
jgi:hypothetical protein